MTLVGYDPLCLEERPVQEWLKESPDNFVVIAAKHPNEYLSYGQKKGETTEEWLSRVKKDGKGKIFCMGKSYFLTPRTNEYYVKCQVRKGQMLPKETLKQKSYYLNIGPYIDGDGVVLAKTLTQQLNKKQQIYGISPIDGHVSDEFVGLTWLQLSTIGVSKGAVLKQQKKNLPYQTDVYFETLMARALYGYSGVMFQPINGFLRLGPAYWNMPYSSTNTGAFGDVWDKIANTREDAIKCVKDKIADIDACFLEAAPRLEGAKRVYFRGMKHAYAFEEIDEDDDNLDAVSVPQVLVSNYTSVTKKVEKTSQFLGNNKCCLYELHLPEGLPYIDMINTTQYKHEEEILLPRDLLFTKMPQWGPERHWNGYKITHVKVDFSREDQFKIDYGCHKHPEMSIASLPKNLLTPKDPPKKKQPKKSVKKPKGVKTLPMTPENVTGDLEVLPIPPQGPLGPEVAEPKPKKKRCPNGSRRHKQTGECVPTNPPPPPPPQQPQPKLKRCPNGTRRNKKTKKCEPKQ